MDDETGTQAFTREITTPLEWSDLVLDKAALEALDEIVQWRRHYKMLLEDWKLARRMGPGYAALFLGLPGTGKTLAATLIGKQLGCAVHRVDLARVMSERAGETERNLAALLAQAQEHNWILFVEAEDDRHANQKTAYLLQRVEDFPVVVIVASNLAALADEAFARRFQSVIHFPAPDAGLRLRLWRDIFSGTQMAPDIDFEKLARDQEMTGGDIVDVLRHAVLRAMRRTPQKIQMADIEVAVAR